MAKVLPNFLPADRDDFLALESTPQIATARPRVSRHRRLLPWTLYLVYLVVLAWGGLWLYGTICWGIQRSRSNPNEVWEIYYTELYKSGVQAVSTVPDHRHIDVLMLGGSVLEQVGPELNAQLQARLGKSVRVWNLAYSAHTSRDSLLKYRFLRDRKFDLVVVYHGINDARMNCCSAELYRDDYSHCQWYRSIERRAKVGNFDPLVFAAEDLSRFINLGQPSPDQLAFGKEIKTPRAFRKNFEEFAQISQNASSPLMLMTFAYHLPEGYSRERFERGELDYGSGTFSVPVELWGIPENVVAAINAHDQVIRELAAARPNLLFFEMQRELPTTGRIFSDICHLTPEGCGEFVTRMMPTLEPWLANVKASHDVEREPE